MALFIINQDRDAAFKKTTENLFCNPAYYEGKLFGFNLYLGENFLGTFDSPEEAEVEITNIGNCAETLYCVGGFSDYDNCEDPEDLESLCKYIDEMPADEYETADE